jgi:tetratricopeptide (TPR) repeat protein
MKAKLWALTAYYGFDNPAQAATRAKEAAHQAIAIDPSLSEAHAALAFALGFNEWNWKECESEARRAIELNPAGVDAHSMYASACLLPQSRLGEADREFQRAQELDPLDLFANFAHGFCLLAAGRYEEAVGKYKKVLELRPAFGDVLWDYGMALGYARRYEEAEAVFKRFVKEYEPRQQSMGPLELYFVGRPEEAKKEAAKMAGAYSRIRDERMDLARHFAIAGLKDAAIRAIEDAIRVREPQVMWIKVDPRLASLHGDARYEALVKKVGL